VSDVLYPYDTLEGELGLVVGTPILDDKPASASLCQAETHTIHLYQAKHSWDRVALPLRAQVDHATLEKFESAHGETAMVVVANCRPTNTRQSLTLKADKRGGWEGSLELERDNYRDRVELKGVLTPVGGTLRTRPVAFSPAWNVYFDEPPSLRFRGTLSVRWVNFKSPPPGTPAVVAQFPDATHVVSFAGGMPEVLLNSAFEGLEPLLKDRRDRRDPERALHDMQRVSIARGVWMALVADAMAAVKPGDEDEAPDWPQEDWQKEVLKHIVLAVDPAKSEAELLSMAANDWRSHPGAAEFYARAEAIIGDIVKANQTLRRFAQNYGQEEQP
jgi:hypothetical protein